MGEWIYYNHALISNLAPHKTPSLDELKERWKNRMGGGYPILARWTENYDCKRQTKWWFCICDKPFDISSLKAKRRNVITNGIKFCDVKMGDPLEYADSLYHVFEECQLSYPPKNRSHMSKKEFVDYLSSSVKGGFLFFLCFFKKTKECVGYSVVLPFDDHVDLISQKALPPFERYSVNAALVNEVLRHYSNSISSEFYICDGSRNINHSTHFQDYLEKYFNFRKAYCTLRIKYRWWLAIVVKTLFPLRKIFNKFDNNRYIHLFNAILIMEEAARFKYE